MAHDLVPCAFRKCLLLMENESVEYLGKFGCIVPFCDFREHQESSDALLPASCSPYDAIRAHVFITARFDRFYFFIFKSLEFRFFWCMLVDLAFPRNGNLAKEFRFFAETKDVTRRVLTWETRIRHVRRANCKRKGRYGQNREF